MKSAGWLALALVAASLTVVTPPVEAAPPPFTVVVLPDTQIATQNHPEYFHAQTRWTSDNRDALALKFVAHVGDIVEWPVRTSDWDTARAAMARLDGRVPYAVAVGNHDMDAWPGGHAAIATDRRTSYFNRYFPRSRFAAMPGFGGSLPANASDNTYHLFSAGDVGWLVLTLKYQPTDAELAWGAGVVAANPGRHVIINTHDYMNGTARSASGQRIWNAIAGRYPNVSTVLGGHYTNQGYRSDAGVNGNLVHQIMADFQTYDETDAAENSYLRIMRFGPSGDSIVVRTYSPYFGTYKTDARNQFIINGG
jgi:hypothetical protein